MRIAVLGVGLIGGSIGLAAKRRLGRRGRRVRPRRRRPSSARSSSARWTVAADSVAEAVRGADVVFCAAPVGALPELVARGARRRAARRGRHRRRLDQARAGRRARAGARRASASSAATRWPAPRPRGSRTRAADLFEGARWYLTPTERSSGVHYDRLQRAVADLGARPQAIDAETHDRADGDGQPPAARARQRARRTGGRGARRGVRAPARGGAELPRHDPRRGRQPARSGRDIFAANGDAVAGEIDARRRAPP